LLVLLPLLIAEEVEAATKLAIDDDGAFFFFVAAFLAGDCAKRSERMGFMVSGPLNCVDDSSLTFLVSMVADGIDAVVGRG